MPILPDIGRILNSEVHRSHGGEVVVVHRSCLRAPTARLPIFRSLGAGWRSGSIKTILIGAVWSNYVERYLRSSGATIGGFEWVSARRRSRATFLEDHRMS